jgi:hypothetical protein
MNIAFDAPIYSKIALAFYVAINNMASANDGSGCSCLFG